ncbi:hypothetical protein K525DRAFT_169255, partial [Schizophyllum commune Loenen D]
MFDWMRMLYERMRYLVTCNGETAEGRLWSDVGVLAGDTLSPSLFNFYVRCIHMQDRPGDVMLAGMRVKNVEQADDGILLSHFLASAQYRLGDYAQWARLLGFVVSIAKTEGVAFGYRGPPLNPLTLDREAVHWRDQSTVLGILFCALQGDVLDQHHLTQARKGSAVASALLALQRYLGDLPLRLAIKVYQARVEPILAYGCEVGIALTKPARDALEKVQLMFFRRVLGYSTRSMRAIIFSETGILPILHRRLILALHFYKRMLDLPADTIAAHAFRDALALYAAGRPGWIGDLATGLRRLEPI